MWHWRRKKKQRTEISPEEILIDAHNLPSFNAGRLEGRLHRPIEARALRPLILLLLFAGLFIVGRAGQLMAINGEQYQDLSERNRLGHSLIFAERGIIYDRNGMELAWNVPHVEDGAYEEYDQREYATTTGLAHVLGYVRMPARDAKGVLYREGIEGLAGVELAYNDELRGKNGTKIVETDACMQVVSEGVYEDAQPGAPIHLSIDATIQHKLYSLIASLAKDIPFRGGAGVLMDVRTGEILALTSYPEYEPNGIVSGNSERISTYANDDRVPYLDRVVAGQYTPGSIVKPYLASAALTEGLVRPETTFVSTGALRLANPYHPGQYSTFTDWKAHGVVNLRRALAVSSNVYFYYIGGGFGDQEGLGIDRINQYMHMYGFGMPTGIKLDGEKVGVIPSPKWKAENFPNDPTWRIGDTYNTSIGQYGFQVTPLQMVRGIAAIANGGLLLTPRLETEYTRYGVRKVPIPEEHLQTVRGGMRDAVLEGTAKGLNVPYVDIAAKTGTAEIDAGKKYVHAWSVGFFPYENPRYAFAVVMERGPHNNVIGGVYVMRQFFDWLHENDSQYLGGTTN